MRKYLAEFIGTFFFVLTVGCSVIAPGAGSFAPLALGSALMVMAYALGGISGGAFNPAIAVGITTMGLSKLSALWIFLVADFAGGAVAGILFKFLNPEDR